MRRCANERPWVVSLQNSDVARAEGLLGPEGSSTVPVSWREGRWSRRGLGPRQARKKMFQEPGRPVRSVENRRPKAKETGAKAECVAGVGGPNKSDEAGGTPDPAEQSGPALDRTSDRDFGPRGIGAERRSRPREIASYHVIFNAARARAAARLPAATLDGQARRSTTASALRRGKHGASAHAPSTSSASGRDAIGSSRFE
jgi:hypothetical protein